MSNLLFTSDEWDPKFMHDDAPEYQPLDDGETETTFADDGEEWDLDEQAAAQNPDPEDYEDLEDFEGHDFASDLYGGD